MECLRNKCGQRGMGGGNPSQRFEYRAPKASVLKPLARVTPTHASLATFVPILIFSEFFVLFLFFGDFFLVNIVLNFVIHHKKLI